MKDFAEWLFQDVVENFDIYDVVDDNIIVNQLNLFEDDYFD